MLTTSLKSLINWLKTNWLDLFFIFLIIGITIFISAKNYAPGTYLTGWDNLHPEFNFKLNIERSLNSAWQEYQGLGVPGGMAHASDITRQLFLWLLSAVVANNLLRYIWLFLMLGLGPIGIYFLLRYVFLKGGNKFLTSFASLVGSMFYLFNLGTLQYFFLPYESFLSFYGFLPWLIFSVCFYLDLGDRKSLIWLFLVALLATSAFYVQTMFVVYFVLLLIFCFEGIISKGKTGIKRSIVVVAITLLVNSFWLLPVIYSTVSNSSSLINSKINSLATPETQIQNIARGNFEDIVSLKGFWWDYYDLIKPEEYDYLYANWITYLNNPIFQKISTTMFSLIVLGLFLSIFKKNKYFKWSYFGIPLLIVCYFMLASVNPPFGEIFKIIFTKFSILSEIFRSVFTKWSIPAVFIYSIGLGFVIHFLGSSRFKIIKFISIAVGLAVILTSIYTTKPFFNGMLISERMRVSIPNEYFEVFSFFDKEPNNGAVAYLPVHVFWGWYFTDWGYNGSGFLWYGIKQPIVARTFDVWSSHNESFYYEIYKTIYDNDYSGFKDIINKYNISYLFLDSSEINPGGGGQKLLYLDRINSFTSNIPELELVFNSGSISVYRFNKLEETFVSSLNNYSLVTDNYQFSNVDKAFKEQSDYVSSNNGTTFPFADFKNGNDVEIEYKENSIKLTSGEVLDLNNKKIILPEFEENESIFKDLFNPEWITVTKENRIEIEIPNTEWVNDDFSVNRGYETAKNCDVKSKGEVFKKYLDDGVYYKAVSGGVSCDYIYFPTVKYNQAYLLSIIGKNISGRGMKVYLYNVDTGRLDLEEILPFSKPYESQNPQSYISNFVIYPKNLTSEKGYTMSFETRSFGKVASENILYNINFAAIPLNWISGIKVIPANYSEQVSNLEIKNVKKYGTAIYKVETTGSGILELGQGFERGWKAFPTRNFQFPIFNFQLNINLPIFNEELEHVKVNNWSNGFIIENSMKIDNYKLIIVFWPQFLEWGGFVLLIITVISLILLDKKPKN